MDRKKILIVDDSELIRAIYMSKLQAAGFDVKGIGDANEAVMAAELYNPDLVMLDLMLKDQHGLKVLQAMRADERFAKTKIIVLSAKSDAAEINQAIAAGANDFLVKATSTPNLVVDKIKSVLAS